MHPHPASDVRFDGSSGDMFRRYVKRKNDWACCRTRDSVSEHIQRVSHDHACTENSRINLPRNHVGPLLTEIATQDPVTAAGVILRSIVVEDIPHRAADHPLTSSE
jgi:hypothetical protein